MDGCKCPVPGYTAPEYNGCTWWVDNTTVPNTRHFVNNCGANPAGCGKPQLTCWPHFSKGLTQESINSSAMNALIAGGSNYSCDMNNFEPGHGELVYYKQIPAQDLGVSEHLRPAAGASTIHL